MSMMAGITSKTELIGTKYSKPGVNPYLICRHRLHQRLEQSLTSKLTLVVAPAGYGKTTTVLDWLGKSGLPAAWVSLDSYDNNPMVFWRYVSAALDGIVNGLSKETEYVFSSHELLKANIHINILIDQLSEVQSDFLLVLDNLHLITDPSILQGLSYLIDYLPANMHLVFISRTEPELDLARHRIKWQIKKLDEKDLRFEKEEIFRFYQARGYTLENDDVKKVETYTEGWAAALVAVAMSMEDAIGRNDVIHALPRSSRDIEQYLKDEVIGTWRQEKRIFAVKTSILNTLSADLCDAVTGDDNGSQMLKEISEGNGFLTTVDNQGQGYRYHPLFKNLLYKLLLETSPEQIPSLYIRAAHWFLQHDFLSEAVELFLNAGSYLEAIEIIEYQIDHLIHKKDFGTLLSWIKRLPEEMKDNSFKVATIYVLYYTEIRRYDLSRQWIDRMKALQDNEQYSSSPEWISYSRTACTMVEANLLLREGNIEFASLLFLATETDVGKYYKMPEYNDFNIADIYFYRCPATGLLKLDREAWDKYDKLIEGYRRMISKNPGYAPLGIGEYFYENNQLEEALSYLLKAIEEAREANSMGALVPAMVDISRIKRAQGDMQGAFEALDASEKMLQSYGTAHWFYLMKAFRCRLYMDMGDTVKVEEWFVSSKLNLFTEMNSIKEYELIVYSRALMAKNRLQDASLLLQRLLSFTEDNERHHSTVEILNLLAILAYQNNRMSKAVHYLERSLSIGMKEGYIRSYLDELEPMADLLGYYTIPRRKRLDDPSRKELIAFARNLLFQMRGNLSTVTMTTNTDESNRKKNLLTAQEEKVLELLFEANTNKEISTKLGISLTTVKSHIGSIYSKLGVKNRAQCIKLIHETGLLE